MSNTYHGRVSDNDEMEFAHSEFDSYEEQIAYLKERNIAEHEFMQWIYFNIK